MRILFTGGATGGHFFPIIAIARELKRIAEDEQIIDLELYYMGPDDFGKEIIAAEEIFFFQVGTGKIRRYTSMGRLLTKHEFLILYPAFRGRGTNPKWRLEWLIRQRLIPIVRVGAKAYFDVDAIEEWLKQKAVPARDVAKIEPRKANATQK